MTVKNKLSLTLSWILVIYSILGSFLTDITLTNKHFIGIGILTILTLINIRSKKLFNYLFLITLIIGTLNLINFFYLTINFKFGFLEFNPIFLSLFLIFIITNPAFLNDLFQYFEPEKTDSDKELKKKKRERKIRSFEKSLNNKNREELENISKENSGYTIEARQAAENLLHKNAL
jgi:hypothetical protein